MTEKQCIICRRRKPLGEFYPHPKAADGLHGSCKACKRDYQRRRVLEKSNDPAWVASEAERHRQKQRRHHHAVRKHDPVWRDKAKKRAGVWAKRNPERRAAQNAANNAIRDGRLVRKTECETCGAGGRLQKHHDDYSKPLEVRWLCTECHGKQHRSR